LNTINFAYQTQKEPNKKLMANDEDRWPLDQEWWEFMTKEESKKVEGNNNQYSIGIRQRK
jgi:hypothetical protein